MPLEVWIERDGAAVRSSARPRHASMLDAVVEATEAAREAEGSGVVAQVRDESGRPVFAAEAAHRTKQRAGRLIIGTWGGVESSWRLRKVDRAALYGEVKRRRFDAEGREAERAHVDDAGRLVRSGCTSRGYIGPGGGALDESQLVGIMPDGSVCDRYAATVGRPVPMVEAQPSDLLNMAADSVLALEPVEVAPAVRALLDSGRMLACRYAYRATSSQLAAVILSNRHGDFAVVGREVTFEWCEPGVAPTLAPDVEPLDFGMMGGGW